MMTRWVVVPPRTASSTDALFCGPLPVGTAYPLPGAWGIYVTPERDSNNTVFLKAHEAL